VFPFGASINLHSLTGLGRPHHHIHRHLLCCILQPCSTTTPRVRGLFGWRQTSSRTCSRWNEEDIPHNRTFPPASSKRRLIKYHHLYRISVCNPFTIKLLTYDHLTARRRLHLTLRQSPTFVTYRMQHETCSPYRYQAILLSFHRLGGLGIMNILGAVKPYVIFVFVCSSTHVSDSFFNRKSKHMRKKASTCLSRRSTTKNIWRRSRSWIKLCEEGETELESVDCEEESDF